MKPSTSLSSAAMCWNSSVESVVVMRFESYSINQQEHGIEQVPRHEAGRCLSQSLQNWRNAIIRKLPAVDSANMGAVRAGIVAERFPVYKVSRLMLSSVIRLPPVFCC